MGRQNGLYPTKLAKDHGLDFVWVMLKGDKRTRFVWQRLIFTAILMGEK